MTGVVNKTKIEYGDFQTPIELAEQICQKLRELGVAPDVVIEPTCGVGNFLEAATLAFESSSRIVGVEVNPLYLQKLSENPRLKDQRVEIKQGDFFSFDWQSLVQGVEKSILVLGNFPWVTNSTQGAIDGLNLPNKNNFQNHSGLDAITGKSNFDISEWMLIQAVQWLQNRNGHLAMLCKASVARKLLSYLHTRNLNLAECATYTVDTKKYFDANVEACLLFCKFDQGSKNYFCDVYNDLKSSNHYRIGYRNKILIRDIDAFDQFSALYDESMKTQWRSGIKHDCSNIMEFRKVGDRLINGLGEVVELEDTYLFPLIKGSDVAQGRVEQSDRFVLVPQRFVGESTENLKHSAPRTWLYLETHAQYLENRKSRVYQKHPRFSIFGVGAYTFTPWKIAICGLYKKLEFRLVSPINGQPAVFDDTVYFLSFDDETTARATHKLLNAASAIAFYSSLIFWDEKRPIKASILNRLNLSALAALEAKNNLNRSTF